MKERIEAFLEDLDQTLAAQAQGEVLEVYHIGRSALGWKYAYNATTKDIDILRPQGGEALLTLAPGPQRGATREARRHPRRV